MASFLDKELNKTELIWEAARFKTFKNWPFGSSTKCSPFQMAQAGWYCTSNDPKQPSARCAFCLKELNCWEKTDDAWGEHEKHSPACPFVAMKKRECEITVREMFHLVEQRVLKIMELQHNEETSRLEHMYKQVLKAIHDKNKPLNGRKFNGKK